MPEPGELNVLPPPKKVPAFPLSLVSPHMRGDLVRQAQTALDKNRYGDFLQGGKVDGEFGPWTARATARAKYYLGFLSVNQQYGQDLHDILTGKTKLSVARTALRKRRIDEQEPIRRGERAWEAAGRDIKNRVTETPPGSNRNYITLQAYKLVGAWCAMACSVWASVGGSKIPVLGKGAAGRYHYCPQIFSDAREGRNGLTLVKPDRARKGDWVLFDWDTGGWADHVGLFGEWLERPADQTQWRMRTREGNTSYEGTSGSQSDGGAAAERTSRKLANVVRNSRGDYGIVRLER